MREWRPRSLPAALAVLRLAALALLLVVADTAGAKPKPAPNYFPLRVNDWWRYRATQASGGSSELLLTVVSEQRERDGSTRGCVEVSSPSPLIRDCYSKTSSAVLLREQEYLGGGGKISLEPPRPLLKLPIRPGATWSWSGTARANVRVEESSQVVGSEKIEVPAGRFQTLKVVTRIEQGGVSVTKTSWYAPGVGLVQQATQSSGVDSETVLVDYSFKPKR
jgi:hypothetical protein